MAKAKAISEATGYKRVSDFECGCTQPDFAPCRAVQNQRRVWIEQCLACGFCTGAMRLYRLRNPLVWRILPEIDGDKRYEWIARRGGL